MGEADRKLRMDVPRICEHRHGRTSTPLGSRLTTLTRSGGRSQIVLILTKAAAACECSLEPYQVLLHLASPLMQPEHKLGVLIDDQHMVKAELVHPVTLANCVYQLVPTVDMPVDATGAVDECKVESTLREAATAVVGSEVTLLHSSTLSDITNVPFVLALGPTGLVVAFRGTHDFSDVCIDARARPVTHDLMVGRQRRDLCSCGIGWST